MKRIFTFLITSIVLSALSRPAHALDILGRADGSGGQGVTRGLVALYRFNSTRAGTALPANLIADESGVGTPLDLQISSTTAIQRKCDQSFFDPVSGTNVPVCYLDFVEGSTNIVKSITAATKITQACKASNELTIEAWLRNDRSDELTKEGRMLPLKIMTLARNTPGLFGTGTTAKYAGASNDVNFFLGIDYDMAAQFSASVRQGPRTQKNAATTDGFISIDPAYNAQQAARYALETSQATVNTPDSADQHILVNNKLQHVVFTVSKEGVSKLYVSSASGTDTTAENPFELFPIERARSSGVTGVTGNIFSGWGDNFYLALGNEPTYTDTTAPVTKTGGNQTFTTENREWRGEIYLMAVYCSAHTESEILGDLAPGTNLKSYPPNPAVTVTPTHQIAAQIYNRITGVKIPVTAPIISGVNDPRIPGEDYAGRGMVQLIQAGDYLGAAKLASNESNFINITVRDFAKRMSTRDETVNTPLNDFVATIIGVTRDNIPATQLLTSNFFYMADPTKTAAPSNMFNDLLMSNNHYDRLEAAGYDLNKVLKKVDGQKISTGTSVVDHPDPAGVLTSRAFLAAHAVGGTNRRIIEYAFREFECIPIGGWADSTGPDNRIGKDVDRYPGGDHTKFLTTCRSCHSNMDGFRGAFAKFHFNNNFVKHTGVISALATSEDKEKATDMCQNPIGVACKMNRNDDLFPEGYQTVDSTFINNATRGSNIDYFGWPTTTTGTGAKQFGQMLAGSKGFPRCMAKRVFRSVCKRDPAAGDQTAIDQLATSFVNDNYNLKTLFARTVITRECLGNLGQ